MTLKEAKKLREGNTVEHDDGTLGIIREVGYGAVKIEWADGKWALFPFADERCPWEHITLIQR